MRRADRVPKDGNLAINFTNFSNSVPDNFLSSSER